MEPTPEKPKSRRGFASMDPDKRRAISRLGGASVPSDKRSFSRDRSLAKIAGAAGGRASFGGRRRKEAEGQTPAT